MRHIGRANPPNSFPYYQYVIENESDLDKRVRCEFCKTETPIRMLDKISSDKQDPKFKGMKLYDLMCPNPDCHYQGNQIWIGTIDESEPKPEPNFALWEETATLIKED